ncbi:hypothetical protein [Tateyamaria sp.]|uniref:hypothetical protein n=1 Tax=Tateyamaria sp. TaxID=1929288 RepID=UPI00329CA296
MAKKPTPAELKQQGEELSKQIAEVRKKDVNFAMVMGKDALVFHTDRKKNCDVLWRTAKKEAGGAKGATGIASMSGKVMVLDVDDPDSVPAPLLKMAKKHFAERGAPIRIMLKGEEEPADGADNTADAEDEKTKKAAAVQTPEQNPKSASDAQDDPSDEQAKAQKNETADADRDARIEALRKSLIQDFKAMQPDLKRASQSQDAGVNKKVTGLARIFIDQVKTDVKKAHSVMGLLQTTINSAKDNGQLGADDADKPNTASITRRKKLAALEKGVDKLLERLG